MEKLIKYITQSKNAGLTEQEIINNLKQAGWEEDQIQEAFSNTFSKQKPSQATKTPRIEQEQEQEQIDYKALAKKNKKSTSKIWIISGIVIIIVIVAFGYLWQTQIKNFNNTRRLQTITNAKTVLLQSELSNLSSTASMFYNLNDYSFKNFCKNEKVQTILNNYPQNNCKDSESKYIIYAKAVNNYVCIDSNGSSKRLKTKPNPNSFVCEEIHK